MSDNGNEFFELGPGESFGAVSSHRPSYRPRWWLHILLFLVTLFTTTFFGAFFAGDTGGFAGVRSLTALLLMPRFYLEGLKFSIPLLVILLSHEMGHYVTCLRHGLRATPPFFIPAPFGIGTFGAIIRIKEPIGDKQQLLDVGAAGPIAGFLVSLPFLVYGIAASRVTEMPVTHGFIVFGEPLIFTFFSHLVHPGLTGNANLIMHPMASAAWFGLLVTALNLLPFAQLDGGHIAYAMFGKWHRKLAWPLLLVLFGLGFVWIGWWLWTIIAVVLGVRHPRMWDEDVPLDPRRRKIGWICFLIFVLCFMPNPIHFVP
ncbi:MAG: site-2 protease family protein [Acidobacteria bacterium]|nr:site-2 protease family protein [Acidobacteriota bacterium]